MLLVVLNVLVLVRVHSAGLEQSLPLASFQVNADAQQASTPIPLPLCAQSVTRPAKAAQDKDLTPALHAELLQLC